VSIHGGMTQNKRTRIIEQFNKGKFGVLVCTDVAARGLHIANVSHIYNYEIPKDSNNYIHRIGRTARAGESGKVINLPCERDHDNFSRVISDYRNFTIEKVELPKMKRIYAVGTEELKKPMFRKNNFRRNNKRSYNSNNSDNSSYNNRRFHNKGNSNNNNYTNKRPHNSLNKKSYNRGKNIRR